MKVSIVVAAFVVACVLGFGVQAQAQDAPKEHSMTGCLQKGMDAGTFKLTDLEKGPKEVVIAETTAKLDPHAGHKIEITGSVVTGKDPQAHTMKVTAVKMISPTCP
ncbi:MAG: hypothetical protein HY313_07400 [Acidobacteria bacterium]|nr:hypothetical protein [Acidobacteriota bacterium]